MGDVSVIAAAFIILIIMLIGIIFDIIAMAFASCDPAPFISMASRKIKKAKSAIKLLQNADIVSNICGDVVGDICGIVSGAAGAAISIKIAVTEESNFIWAIVISSVIAAVTVAGKAAGKTIAIKRNKEIVSFVSYIYMFFVRDGRKANGGSPKSRETVAGDNQNGRKKED
jgi:CBS domain containing-hemolysin-like protein